ncbi:LAQU0S04e06832g1_1 [Lachancea quebecensis]|uniref:LAQU0S04e06832g1_1 n=1 Tax=Lachancea quebecensis TaxID=1654605 RepID=A0A0P1KRG2_9SACH|nr:LAQU0S04e06832g1_1 [Lachancea quebecensis]
MISTYTRNLYRAARSLSSRIIGLKTMSSKGRPENAKFLKAHPVSNADECKWIGLERIEYLDPNGTKRQWDSAVRRTRNSGGVDGVGILAILRTPGQEPEILLQKQFRPPVEGVCIEMPAGLIDSDESVDTAALRELKEETGYSGKIVSKTPTIFNDPGFTNTNLSLVTVEIDTTAPENQNPQTQLEDNEFIECIKVPLKSFADEMDNLAKQGYKLDARVQNVAQGIKLAQKYSL